MADAIGWGMTHRPYPNHRVRHHRRPDREKAGGSGSRGIGAKPKASRQDRLSTDCRPIVDTLCEGDAVSETGMAGAGEMASFRDRVLVELNDATRLAAALGAEDGGHPVDMGVSWVCAEKH
jgi:hypothetical protein